jgi:pyruvate dehydrogenase E2 component (dihydrolipoamide acetyltransferase)
VGATREVLLPDIGDFQDVDVVEVLVKPGQRVHKDDSLIVLETDKATMEVPSPASGIVTELRVGVGSKVSRGDPILVLEAEEGAAEAAPPPQAATPRPAAAPPPAREASQEPAAPLAALASTRAEPARVSAAAAPAAAAAADTRPRAPMVHASPSVRQLARELGIDLALVAPSGPRGRVLREDVRGFVKQVVAAGAPGASAVALPRGPEIDFAKYGPIEVEPLNRIRRVAAANLQRSWVTVPHVTQHDEADVTELEAFRQGQREAAEKRGVKLTFLPFLMKACATVLREMPQFNASLDRSGESLVLKRYCHLGVAVDTPLGLVVPVVRDVDRKGILELAAEVADLSAKARERRLRAEQLEGGTFSISSLGGIGGSAFTPIVNHPEVAILGVSRMAWKPVYRGEELVRRLLLPLSLSYDHRVIDGADAARFTTRLAEVLSDLRVVLL